MNKSKLFAIVFFAGLNCLITISLVSAAAENDTSVNVIELVAEAPLAHSQPMKGTFTQSKNIKPLKRPFISTGKFVYLPNQGLLWHTKKPVDSIKLFANDGVYNIDAQGELQKEAQVDNDFFLALFAADEERLKKFFVTRMLPNTTLNKNSCLSLTPLNSNLQHLFEEMTLCVVKLEPSDTNIPTQITLTEAQGNQTLIKLALSDVNITPEELAYFE